MDIFTVSILISFIGFVVIGVFMSRRVKTKADYFVSGRSAGTILIVGTLVASYLSTVALMGEAGTGYAGFAWPTMLIIVVSQLGYLIGVLLFGRYLRASTALTLPEFFGDRFHSRRLRALSGFAVLIGIGLYLVAVTRGMSLVLEEITGLNTWVSLLIAWGAFSLFTIMSGSKGVLVTDTVMFFIFMVGGTVGFLSIVYAAGGFSNVMESLTTDTSLREGLMWHGAIGEGAMLESPLQAVVYFVTFGVVWLFVIAVSPWQSSRYMMAKSNHVAVRAGVIALVVVLLFYVVMLFAAYSVNLINPNIAPAENVFIWSAYNIMPLGIGVVVVAGIMSAALSSASTFLSLVGFSAVNDVLPIFRRQSYGDAEEKTGIRDSRIAMLIVGFIALVITVIASPTVLEIGYMAAAFFAASWGFVAFASTQSKKVTERGAFWGMLLGGATVLVFEGLSTFSNFALPTLLDPVLLGLIASLLGLTVGSATSEPSAESLAYISNLKQQVEVQETPTEIRKTKIYLGASIAVIAIFVATVAYLYLPQMITTA